MIINAFVLLITFSAVSAAVLRLWPLLLVAVGLFGLVRRPGWVRELDLWAGPEATRALDRPQRLFSVLLIVLKTTYLLFTFNLINGRIIGPNLLIGIGFLLLWRRAH